MAIPSIETLAELLCALQDYQRLSGARCKDGDVCVPNCQDPSDPPLDKQTLLSLMQTAVLCEGGGGPGGGPVEIDLSTLENLLQELLDKEDVETGTYTCLCSSSDPNITYLAYFEMEGDPPTPTPYYLVVGDNTPVAGFPADAIKCPDRELVDGCYYNPSTNEFYQRILVLTGSQVTETIWIDSTGSVLLAPPIDVIPCQDSVSLLDCETC